MRYNSGMSLQVRLLFLLGTFLKSISYALATTFLILLILQHITFARLATATTILLFLVAAVVHVAGLLLCAHVRRKYPIVRSMVLQNTFIAIVAAGLEIFGTFGCAAILLIVIVGSEYDMSPSSHLTTYLFWALAFLAAIIFLFSGLFLRYFLGRPPVPNQGFEVLPSSHMKE
jgi:hypothetical protein